MRSRPISTGSSKAGGCASFIFFAVFAAFGGAFLFFMFIRPMMHAAGASGWVPTPCVIDSAKVQSYRGDKSDTYSIAVKYHYTFNGQTYTGDRYNFSEGSSSSYDWRHEAVEKLRKHRKATCYVNPKQPGESVLNRELSSDIWFGLIPLVFVLIGVGGMIFTATMPARQRRKLASVTRLAGEDQPALTSASNPTMSRAVADVLPDVVASDGPVVLKPASRIAKAIGLGIFSLIWNGILSVFLYQAYKGLATGHIDWFLTIFMIPFVLIGLGVIGGAFYYLLAAMNPTVSLTIANATLHPGDPLDVAWDLAGNTNRLRHISIKLEGREEATYRRGSNTHTDKHVFTAIELIETDDPAQITSGAASITIPPDTMHSFTASNNKIIWSLHVRGDIPRWPDIHDEFHIALLPANYPTAANPDRNPSS